MTTPLPNELKPEVVEALARVRKYVKARIEKPIDRLADEIHCVHTGTEWEGELRLSDLMVVTDASVSLHAERAGAVDLPEGCPSVAYWSPAWGLRNALPLGPHLGCVEVETHPKGTRSRLQASPREWDAETIKDAPEGYYRWQVRAPEWRDQIQKKDALDLIRVHSENPPHNVAEWRFFGPVPQPPPPSREDRG